MLEELKALVALESTGTISEAAVRLRLTQSAVSKRIQSLEAMVSYKVVEPDGRRLRLTANGLRLLAKARPLLLGFESLKDLQSESKAVRPLALGVADSIACSWGPKLLRKVLQKEKAVELEIHVHRSTLVLEQIRSGRYEAGLIAGIPQGSDLAWELILEEPMVFIGAQKRVLSETPLLTIENSSATWKNIGRAALSHDKIKGRRLVFLESFSAAVQMAKEGFGQALVPMGLAKSMGIPTDEITILSPRIKRQVHLVARKTVTEIGAFKDLQRSLKEHAQII